MFAFFGRRRTAMKLLYFDGTGLCLLYKRLEKGRFQLPRIEAGGRTATLDATALAMLLDGIDIEDVKRPKLWEPAR